MPIAITPQLVSSIVCELIRYRDRVDTILAERKASEGLPFLLPPVPTKQRQHLDEMVRFFATDVGQSVLILNGRDDDYELLCTDPGSSESAEINEARDNLFELFFEAAQFKPEQQTQTDPEPGEDNLNGPEVGLRLAWYVVRSQRLSRHPAIVNLLLATTDTLLEIVGQNAGAFVRHPRTRGIFESLLSEFALKGDPEDQSFLLLFRRLLGSTVLAFGDNQVNVRNQTALRVFYGALSSVRETLGKEGDDLAATLISADGFEQFLVALTAEVAHDPAFIARDSLTTDVLAAMLTRISRDFPQLRTDPKALLGVIEAGLGAAATSTEMALNSAPGDRDQLLVSLLVATLKEVETRAREDNLFASIANGEVVPGLYRAALTAITTSPLRFASAGEVNHFVEELVRGLARVIATKEMKALGSTSTLQLLAVESLGILSRHPRLLAGNNLFATNLLASAMEAGAVVIADGLQREDLLELADQALVAVTANLATFRLEPGIGEAIVATGRGIASAGLSELIEPNGRMAILNTALWAISANPSVWSRLQKQELVEPLVQSLLLSLKADGTGLLTGTRLLDAASRMLHLLSRRGQLFIEKKIDLPQLTSFMSMIIKLLELELGRTIDSESQPYLIERIAGLLIASPERLGSEPGGFLKEILPSLLVDLGRRTEKG